MRNNRLTKNTTDPNYDSIPFKNRDIDFYERKSVEQLQAEEPILFKDLPEVTVRANAKPLSLKTASASQSGKDLQQENQMGKSTYPKGMYKYEMDLIDKKNQEIKNKAKKLNQKQNMGIAAGMSTFLLGGFLGAKHLNGSTGADGKYKP